MADMTARERLDISHSASEVQARGLAVGKLSFCNARCGNLDRDSVVRGASVELPLGSRGPRAARQVLGMLP